MFDRRKILGLIGSSPFTVPTAAKQVLSEAIEKGEAALGAQSLAGGALPFGEHPRKKRRGIVGKLLFNQIEDARDELYRQAEALDSIRRYGFDADIAALRSTSNTFKFRKQFERVLEVSEIQKRANSFLWGNGDDDD